MRGRVCAGAVWDCSRRLPSADGVRDTGDGLARAGIGVVGEGRDDHGVTDSCLLEDFEPGEAWFGAVAGLPLPHRDGHSRAGPGPDEFAHGVVAMPGAAPVGYGAAVRERASSAGQVLGGSTNRWYSEPWEN